MQEYERISRLIAPATSNKAALGLTDDAACIPYGESQLVLTTDSLVEHIHFLPDTAPESLARKLLSVNLSDLAAMAASPAYALLNLQLTEQQDDVWLGTFMQALKEEMDKYAIALIGGDTTASPQGLSCGLTALGTTGTPLLRSGARPGDIIAVTGTIGDAYLGLQWLQQKQWSGTTAEQIAHIIARYETPTPRLDIASKARPYLTAGTDISDGLAADLKRLCRASHCGAAIEVSHIPFSEAAHHWLQHHPEHIASLLTGGDDYELLLTCAPEDWPAIEQKALQTDTPICNIGAITAGNTITYRSETGQALHLTHEGYQHFA